MLHIVTWHWGSKYGPEYVERLRSGIARHMRGEYRFHVLKPGACDLHLTKIPGCFCRLRMFDPKWQAANGIKDGDRIVCIDLDTVITGKLDIVFDRREPFVILQGVNSPTHPTPYNGSLWMLRAGYRPDVWSVFTLDEARTVPFLEFPDDQAWMHHMIPDAAAFGPRVGVYAFYKRGWRGGDNLPNGARIVAFPGRRDPSQFTHLRWVAEHWR